ncbi:hypothetical protein AVEN_14790-1 [Araneus ventricosus]|uniref:Uncharacterized protein n=1 Tax=Araneus ventricosus TaxID=182803 RepID=A0A4Y2FK81_ARAVE|nr:hypothetical protein AVEN_14790-1 [Araneus ventricosus]
MYIVTKIARLVNGESSPTSRIIENDALFHEYSGKYEEKTTTETALVQISCTNRRQITNNDSKNTFSTARRLSAYQIALRTKLQRDSKLFKHTPKSFSLLSISEFLYLFRQDVT